MRSRTLLKAFGEPAEVAQVCLKGQIFAQQPITPVADLGPHRRRVAAAKGKILNLEPALGDLLPNHAQNTGRDAVVDGLCSATARPEF